MLESTSPHSSALDSATLETNLESTATHQSALDSVTPDSTLLDSATSHEQEYFAGFLISKNMKTIDPSLRKTYSKQYLKDHLPHLYLASSLSSRSLDMKHPFVIILDDATFLSRLDSADNKAYMTILKDSIVPESKTAESKSQESKKIVESKIAESKIMKSNIATLKNTLKSLINDKVNFALLDGSKRKTIKEAYAKIWYHLELGKSTAKNSKIVESKIAESKAIEFKTTQPTAQNTPQTIMDDVIDIDRFARKGGKALKESYAKIWHHLDLGKNEAIESYLRDELQLNLEPNLQPNPAHKDNILFSKDFVLQLKRLAAYNYSVYMSDNIRQGYDVIAGNLIYDEEFIPTTLDIKD